MPVEITMPQLSDTMSEGTLVKWLKKEGDKVKCRRGRSPRWKRTRRPWRWKAFEGGTLAHIVAQRGGKGRGGKNRSRCWPPAKKTRLDDQETVRERIGRGRRQLAASQSSPAAPGRGSATSPKARIGYQSGGGVATLVAASSGEIHEPDDVGHGATARNAAPPSRQIPGRGNSNGNGERRADRVFSPLARRIADRQGQINLSEVKGTGPNGRDHPATC